LKSNMKS